MAAGLGPSDVLRVWEWGRNRHAVDRALAILAAAEPGTPHDLLVALPVGQLDAALLALREATYGARLTATSACPSCGLELELELDTRDLRDVPGGSVGPSELEVEGYRVVLRPLDSSDLAGASCAADAGGARRVLLERAIVRVERAGQPVDGTALPEPVVAAVPGLLAELDPQADVTLDLRCPGCDHAWVAPLDVATILWVEIAAHARRLLREVDALARAYGWSEADVLALSPERRQAYLELAGSA